MITKILLFFCAMSWYTQITYAQTNAVEEKPVAFYIDLNNIKEGEVYDAQVDIMGLMYTDKFGKWNDIPLQIYNWKQEKIAGVTLQKTFGLNYFTLKLNELYPDWEMDKIYICELFDESGRKYVLPIKPVSPPEKKGPDIDLLINPISLKCERIKSIDQDNMIEFYGSIEGGKPPYKVSWFVLNDQRTDFLYQPKEERITKAGHTAFIQVDKDPDYYVLFVVEDGCGSVKEKMVHMMCEERQKKINTVFVEPLNDEIVKRFLKIR